MSENPFKNCRPEKNHNGQWCISSDFWEVPCADEKSAARPCEIIQGAYRAGVSDMRGKFNALLADKEQD